jgi:hypothetical protein
MLRGHTATTTASSLPDNISAAGERLTRCFSGGNANFSPNTNGWIAEIAYIPFISNFAPGWPWFNMRLGLQYTWYTEFNGTSVGASATNTLFLYAWFAM